MRIRLLVVVALLPGCSLFRDGDAVILRDIGSPDLAAMIDAPTEDVARDSGVGDADSALPLCVAIGESCAAGQPCCDLGECGAQGLCRPKPCTVSDDCAGLQCVRLADGVEARGCSQAACADCDGQNWCHPTLGCTNRAPCATSDACGSGEVCTSDNVCVPTCRSSAECGARECVALQPAELTSAADVNARVCRAAVCNCRDVDDYCSVDGVCVKDNTTCQVDADCGDSRYLCDGVRCACDDSQADLCRFGCASDADCGETQVCDQVLRRCQTLYCNPLESCPVGTACAPESAPPFAALVCRRNGVSALGDECSQDSDCASAICRDGACRATCRRTSDCPTGLNCVFRSEWLCLEPTFCDGSPCAPGEFCLPGNACRLFCDKGSDCPDDVQCVTGFGTYNCAGPRACPDDRLQNFFSETCMTYCWVDSDCASGDCNEQLNECRD